VTRLAVIFLVGCSVPLGARPDAGPCTPSTAFFASDLWLGYLDANQCATSNCHAFDGGHGYLRYKPPGNMPDPMSPITDWPAAWRDNYYESIQLVRCDDPLKSRLLTVPEGKAEPHPPGGVIGWPPQDEDYFQRWIAAP
jgi:hypothetical protein